MSDENGALAQTPETIEDFRAAATAFSQLTGVLGGFSITMHHSTWGTSFFL
jgi:hypothetical protein